MSGTEDRTIALAALIQAAGQVRELARNGVTDEEYLQGLVASLFRFDAPDTRSVYDGAGCVRSGLELLAMVLTRKPGPADWEVLRYAIAMVQVRESLVRSDISPTRLVRELKTISPDEMEDSDEIYNAVDAVYARIISPLSPRILVHGSHGYLQQPMIVARVRSALLAGIRAAHLWRQLGGSRWRVLLNRKSYVVTARNLLRDVAADNPESTPGQS